jgi:hypothetical protein
LIICIANSVHVFGYDLPIKSDKLDRV